MTQVIEKIDNEIYNLEKVFIPTMGALHDGHISLINDAKKLNLPIVVSIFVNPKQFNDKNDFKNYPRNIINDIEILTSLQVDFVLTPKSDYVYERNKYSKISSGHIGTLFEGKFRPGHFDGVLTVVKRLFEIVNPNTAIFGAKDAQQLFLIKQMVKDRNLKITILEGSTVREKNGLAMSSRNQLLSNTGKEQAKKIYQNLLYVSKLFLKTKDYSFAIEEGLEKYKASNLKVDYLEVVNKETFNIPDENTKELLFLTAAYVDNIRLIDNLKVEL